METSSGLEHAHLQDFAKYAAPSAAKVSLFYVLMLLQTTRQRLLPRRKHLFP